MTKNPGNQLSTYKFISDDSDIRVDLFLSEVYKDASRTYIQKLIKDGYVSVNDKEITKSSYKLNEDDEITLNVPDPIPLEILPEDIPLDIIYEDEDILIVNKPKGMVVHPAPGHTEGTLVNALLYHCNTLSNDDIYERWKKANDSQIGILQVHLLSVKMILLTGQWQSS